MTLVSSVKCTIDLGGEPKIEHYILEVGQKAACRR